MALKLVEPLASTVKVDEPMDFAAFAREDLGGFSRRCSMISGLVNCQVARAQMEVQP